MKITVCNNYNIVSFVSVFSFIPKNLSCLKKLQKSSLQLNRLFYKAFTTQIYIEMITRIE